MKSIACSVLCLCLLMSLSQPLEARNPISGYFSRLFDESRLEIDVGAMLFDSLQQDYGSRFRIASQTELDTLVESLRPRMSRTNLPYQVFVIDTPIPAEIPFPGGPILLSSGVLQLAKTPEAREFLVARNMIHVALLHPLMALKRDGLYAKALKQYKRQPANRDGSALRELVREYARAVANMDHYRADREAVASAANTTKSREAAIEFLQSWSQDVVPFLPWDWCDLPGRIKSLQNPEAR